MLRRIDQYVVCWNKSFEETDKYSYNQINILIKVKLKMEKDMDQDNN